MSFQCPLPSVEVVLGAGGMVWLAQLEPTSAYTTAVFPALVVIGLGMGTIVGPAPAAATSGVASDDSGIASATVETSQFVGGSVGLAVLSTIAGTASGADASVHGFTTAFSVAAGFFLVAALAVAAIMYGGRTGRARGSKATVMSTRTSPSQRRASTSMPDH